MPDRPVSPCPPILATIRGTMLMINTLITRLPKCEMHIHIEGKPRARADVCAGAPQWHFFALRVG